METAAKTVALWRKSSAQFARDNFGFAGDVPKSVERMS
jgi:hypothetical protein